MGHRFYFSSFGSGLDAVLQRSPYTRSRLLKDSKKGIHDFWRACLWHFKSQKYVCSKGEAKRRFNNRNIFEQEESEYFIRFEYEDTLKEFGRGISLKEGRDLITQHLSRFALSNDYDIFES